MTLLRNRGEDQLSLIIHSDRMTKSNGPE